MGAGGVTTWDSAGQQAERPEPAAWPQLTLPSAAGGPLTLLAGVSLAISLTPLLYRLGLRGSGGSEQGSAKTPIPAAREGYPETSQSKTEMRFATVLAGGTGLGVWGRAGCPAPR